MPVLGGIGAPLEFPVRYRQQPSSTVGPPGYTSVMTQATCTQAGTATATLTVGYRTGLLEETVLPVARACAWADTLATDDRVVVVSVVYPSGHTVSVK